ncbi:MAG: acetyl-CoA synthetase, partial [Pirellulaceae bacterium]
MSKNAGGQIETAMKEDRKFPPPVEFASRSLFGSLEAYQEIYDEAKADPEAFWGKLGEEELHWFKPFEKVLEWDEPHAKWFVGGQTNVSYNCLDAHVNSNRRTK